MGYNEINKLKIEAKNSKEKKEISNQEEIRKETQKFFQTIYKNKKMLHPLKRKLNAF